MFMASYPAIVLSAVNGSEPLARHHSLLHETMILFDDVVHAGGRAASASPAQFSALF
jgi:hypothetical protein